MDRVPVTCKFAYLGPLGASICSRISSWPRYKIGKNEHINVARVMPFRPFMQESQWPRRCASPERVCFECEILFAKPFSEDGGKGRHVSHRRSVVDGPRIEKSRSRFVNAVCRRFIALCLAAIVAGAPPAWAGIEDAIKAIQSGDMAAAEKGLQVLIKERDPRAQFL